MRTIASVTGRIGKEARRNAVGGATAEQIARNLVLAIGAMNTAMVIAVFAAVRLS